jgi:hypothetical protein
MYLVGFEFSYDLLGYPFPFWDSEREIEIERGRERSFVKSEHLSMR